MGHGEVGVGLTCCRARCRAARCGRKERGACVRHHIRVAPNAACSRTTTAPPTDSLSLSGSSGSETNLVTLISTRYLHFEVAFLDVPTEVERQTSDKVLSKEIRELHLSLRNCCTLN